MKIISKPISILVCIWGPKAVTSRIILAWNKTPGKPAAIGNKVKNLGTVMVPRLFHLAAGEGFEPSHTESESAVLPLHKPARSVGRSDQPQRTDIIIQNITFFVNRIFSKFFNFFRRGE